MADGITAPGGLGPRNKHLLKAIKRNVGSNDMNSWTKARVAKFTFKKVGGGGGGGRNAAVVENYEPPIDYCKCGGAGSVGEFKDTLIKDYDYPINLTIGDNVQWETNRHKAKQMDYTKTWNLVGPYKNPNPYSKIIRMFKGLRYLPELGKYKLTWFYKKDMNDNDFYEVGVHNRMNHSGYFNGTEDKKEDSSQIKKEEFYTPEGNGIATGDPVPLMNEVFKEEDLFLIKEENVVKAKSYDSTKIDDIMMVDYTFSQAREDFLCNSDNSSSAYQIALDNLGAVSQEDVKMIDNLNRCQYLEDAKVGLPDGPLKTRMIERHSELQNMNIPVNDLQSNVHYNDVDKRGYQTNFPYCSYWDGTAEGQKPWCTLEQHQQASFNKNGQPKCFLQKIGTAPIQSFKRTVTGNLDGITCSVDTKSDIYTKVPDIGLANDKSVVKMYTNVTRDGLDNQGKHRACFGATMGKDEGNSKLVGGEQDHPDLSSCWSPTTGGLNSGCDKPLPNEETQVGGPIYNKSVKIRPPGLFGFTDMSTDEEGNITYDYSNKGLGVGGTSFNPGSNQSCGWADSVQRKHVEDDGVTLTGNVYDTRRKNETFTGLPKVKKGNKVIGTIVDRTDPNQLKTMIDGGSPYVDDHVNMSDVPRYYNDITYVDESNLDETYEDPLVKYFMNSTPMGNPDWDANYKGETLYNKSAEEDRDKIILDKTSRKTAIGRGIGKRLGKGVGKSLATGVAMVGRNRSNQDPNDFYMWNRSSKSAMEGYYNNMDIDELNYRIEEQGLEIPSTAETPKEELVNLLANANYHGIWDDFAPYDGGRDLQNES